MQQRGVSVIFFFALLLLGETALADRTIWYVHPDSALNTIQAGLDSCADNDIVLVGPGTYYENIVWPNTQGIDLVSEVGPEVTVIDGGGVGTVIRCTTDVDATTLIKSLTIRNGAGAVACWGASPTMSDNVVTNNVASVLGSAVVFYGAAPIIVRNTITTNTGNGIVGYGSAIIDTNIVEFNTGVGIGCDGVFSIRNNTISHNGYWGISVSGEWQHFANNTISHNGSGGIMAEFLYEEGDIDSCTITHNYGRGVTFYYAYNILHVNYCNIHDNGYGIFNGDTIVVDADSNWWGHATGPYHPSANPGGLGDTVSDYVDFYPWLTTPGVEERPVVELVEKQVSIHTSIFCGLLQLPESKKCQVYDIMGRVVEPDRIRPGIYFIEIDGVVTQKVVKVR